MNLAIVGSMSIESRVIISASVFKFSRLYPDIKKFDTVFITRGPKGIPKISEEWAIQKGFKYQKWPAINTNLMIIADRCDGAIILWDGSDDHAKTFIKYIKRTPRPYLIDVIMENK